MIRFEAYEDGPNGREPTREVWLSRDAIGEMEHHPDCKPPRTLLRTKAGTFYWLPGSPGEVLAAFDPPPLDLGSPLGDPETVARMVGALSPEPPRATRTVTIPAGGRTYDGAMLVHDPGEETRHDRPDLLAEAGLQPTPGDR